MILEDVYRYPTQHFDFHCAQLTRARPPDPYRESRPCTAARRRAAVQGVRQLW
ncbi:hypothetical protein OG585_44255 [Streptomyces sp. NBC_01340]|uniref:hypothetical protein n=1 Tax=unclassified Streptomyces TaxID=2593676 RepID=UPI00224E421A|nr:MULTISPECIES: hypothetical protein [unclassified Streptomyces]MCX4459751.1 hypothetical protein [Streptomyces sp. NBC_01719]MCX4499109.1 hypothetical protein [Streptomyces sp. NBC_01728]MCX4594980.1 hypothetical protein [Streptomyces sp. NBC_01549]WSI43532.1 hypothetical protein OG585_44255 [Streptomyces sp. NBC_01340]